jgi:SAM-dependent methyltransferase
MDAGKIRKLVRDRYAGIARQESSCCGPAKTCGGASLAEETSRRIGYSEEDVRSVPGGANLGLGCGNPTALASLKKGETVLDLGSGAGFDCFLASREVGPEGRVIGVDMTPEMVEKARENAKRGGYGNVEFRLGEIENLPVADGTVDVVISNCVINLSPHKGRIFQEAFRVLKPGGRLMISDLVVSEALPEWLTSSVSAYVGCVAGAMRKEEYLESLSAAGFREVAVAEETSFPVECFSPDPLAGGMVEGHSVPPEAIEDLGSAVSSIRVQGRKPAGKGVKEEER